MGAPSRPYKILPTPLLTSNIGGGKQVVEPENFLNRGQAKCIIVFFFERGSIDHSLICKES